MNAKEKKTALAAGVGLGVLALLMGAGFGGGGLTPDGPEDAGQPGRGPGGSPRPNSGGRKHGRPKPGAQYTIPENWDPRFGIWISPDCEMVVEAPEWWTGSGEIKIPVTGWPPQWDVVSFNAAVAPVRGYTMAELMEVQATLQFEIDRVPGAAALAHKLIRDDMVPEREDLFTDDELEAWEDGTARNLPLKDFAKQSFGHLHGRQIAERWIAELSPFCADIPMDQWPAGLLAFYDSIVDRVSTLYASGFRTVS